MQVKSCTKLCSILVLSFILSIPLFAEENPVPGDSTGGRSGGPEDSLGVRGISTPERHQDDAGRKALDYALFLPRSALSGLLYSAGRGAYIATDPRFIEKVEDILYLYERRLGWYPVLNLDSDLKPLYGTKLFYRGTWFGASLSGWYSTEHHYQTKASLSVKKALFGKPTKTTITALNAEDDDFQVNFWNLKRWNNIDPGNLNYRQRRREGTIVFGVQATNTISVFATGQYREREIFTVYLDGDIGFLTPDDILSMADPDLLSKQLYTELAVQTYQRDLNGLVEGYAIEMYGGYSQGMENDVEDFYRFGSDVSLYIPVLLHDRFLIPRIAFNGVYWDKHSTYVIPFYEMARHYTFRGVSSKNLLKVEQYTMVPSLEYQWPLSHVMTGFVFTDVLLAGYEPKGINVGDDVPWAVGTGILIHINGSEMGRVSYANGSEGFRVTLSIGSPLFEKNRTDWK